MKYRRFGRTGWQVSEVGYGMWGMAGWTGSDDTESLAALQQSVDLGCNFFDTAWAYGDGHSERLLGRLIASNPDKTLYAATKIPPKNRKWPSRRGSPLDDVFPADYIREYAEKSLAEPGSPAHRPAAVPRLGGRLGGRRPLAARDGRSQARRARARRGHQRQPLGAVERRADAANGTRSTRCR